MAVNNPQLESLEKTQKGLLDTLGASSTARTGEHTPSVSDIAAQQRLLSTQSQIQSIKDKELQERWYGGINENQQTPGGQAGFLGKTIDVLSRPLYGIVGAIDYATGKSGAPSLSKAITENIKSSKRTFGNVLKDSGLPGVVSAPLGFVLDVAFDPINWATVGTAALIPRIAMGAARGTARGGVTQGLRAAAKGAESGITGAVVTTKNIGKALTGRITRKGAEVGRVGKAVSSIEKRAITSSAEYDKLIGRNVIEEVSKSGAPLLESRYRVRIGELIRDSAEKIPFVKNFFKHFDYDNAEWTRLARIKDTLIKVSGTEDEMRAGLRAFLRNTEEGIPFDDALEQARLASGMEARKAAATVSPEINWDAGQRTGSSAARSVENQELDKALSKISSEVDELKRASSDVGEIMSSPDKFVSADHVENALRLASEDTGVAISLDDIKKIIGKEMGDTGWKWFDDTKRRITSIKHEVRFGKNSKTVGSMMEKTIDVYQGFISFFKRGKVGASPTAWTNAIMGNPTMAWMAGINILDPMYIKRVKDATGVIKGSRASDIALGEMLTSTDMLKVMGSNPTLFRKTTGMSPDFLNAKHTIEKIFRIGRDEGLIADNMDIGEVGKSLGYAFDEIADAVREIGGVRPKSAEALRAVGASMKKIKGQRPSDVVTSALKTGRAIDPSDLPTGMLANEFYDSNVANKAFDYIRKRADEGNHVYKLLDVSFNKMSSAYEGIDQTFKLGTIMYTTVDGITEKELRIIARGINLSPEDITRVGNRYKLSGVKSLELANEIYLNYNAMPAAVKVLRNLPLVGSPFASFTYGMALKTGKTFVNNPAVYNKVAFAMKEFSGDKSPLEKGVLSDPRYSYLNEPAMLKLPIPGQGGFFAKNTLYLNMTNMLPYYSLNMFTPTERRYNDLYSNSVVQAIDKSPFVKDPVGSTIFDFFVQPLIIRDSRPLSSFGQPLYPSDASFFEKARAGIYQGVVDPVIPGLWSPVGGLATGYLAPGASEYMPSYRWRQVAQAVQGKTAIGKSSKEPAASRTLRSILGSAGIPVQTPVPLSYLPKDLAEKVKKAGKK